MQLLLIRRVIRIVDSFVIRLLSGGHIGGCSVVRLLGGIGLRGRRIRRVHGLKKLGLRRVRVARGLVELLQRLLIHRGGLLQAIIIRVEGVDVIINSLRLTIGFIRPEEHLRVTLITVRGVGAHAGDRPLGVNDVQVVTHLMVQTWILLRQFIRGHGRDGRVLLDGGIVDALLCIPRVDRVCVSPRQVLAHIEDLRMTIIDTRPICIGLSHRHQRVIDRQRREIMLRSVIIRCMDPL